MATGRYHKETLSAGFTGVFTFRVSPGRQVQIGVKDQGSGGVFDIVNYLADDSVADRILWTSESAITGEYAKSSIAGFVEVGVNVVTPSSGDIDLELLEVKLGK